MLSGRLEPRVLCLGTLSRSGSLWPPASALVCPRLPACEARLLSGLKSGGGSERPSLASQTLVELTLTDSVSRISGMVFRGLKLPAEKTNRI